MSTAPAQGEVAAADRAVPAPGSQPSLRDLLLPPRGDSGPLAPRLRAIAGSLRPSTRVWFDLLTPTAMLVLLNGGELPPARALALLAAIALFHAAHTFLNDVADVEVDRSSSEEDRRARALPSGRATPRDMAIAGWVLLAGSLACALTLPFATLALGGVALALALAYNARPLALAARPLATEVFWPAGWAVMFAICATTLGAADWTEALPYLVFTMLFMGIGESLGQDIRDAQNDAAGGRLTTVVRFGVRRCVTAQLVAQCLSLAAWVWLVVSYPLAPVPALLGSLALLAWIAGLARAAGVLRRGFDQRRARLTHVGSIAAFAAVNLAILGQVAA